MTIPDSGEPILSLENLELRRTGRKLLSRINWRVHRGEHWATYKTKQ